MAAFFSFLLISLSSVVVYICRRRDVTLYAVAYAHTVCIHVQQVMWTTVVIVSTLQLVCHCFFL